MSWIKCSERLPEMVSKEGLPEMSKDVLIWDTGNISIAYREEHEKLGYVWHDYECTEWLPSEVTHWHEMPLPPEPDAE